MYRLNAECVNHRIPYYYVKIARNSDVLEEGRCSLGGNTRLGGSFWRKTTQTLSYGVGVYRKSGLEGPLEDSWLVFFEKGYFVTK